MRAGAIWNAVPSRIHLQPRGSPLITSDQPGPGRALFNCKVFHSLRNSSAHLLFLFWETSLPFVYSSIPLFSSFPCRVLPCHVSGSTTCIHLPSVVLGSSVLSMSQFALSLTLSSALLTLSSSRLSLLRASDELLILIRTFPDSQIST